MARYLTLNDLIRDGMEMRLECRKCRYVERVNPEAAKGYVARVYRRTAYLHSHRLEPVDKGRPDITLEGCLDGVSCPTCRASDWKVDAIKPLISDDDKDE